MAEATRRQRTPLAALLCVLALACVDAAAQQTVVRRTTLVVHDIEASIAFYRDVLDFDVWLDLPGQVSENSLPSDAAAGEPSRFVIMKGRHPWIGMIGLLQYGPPRPLPPPPQKVRPGDAVMMLETEAIEPIYDRARRAGTPIFRELEDNEVTGAGGRSWTARFAFLFDPDGHLIELNERVLAPGTANLNDADVELRRRFVDSRWGQLHLRVATPTRSVAAEPPLIVFHQTPLSGRMFDGLMPLLARNRVVYAVDTPGYGESDFPPEPQSIEGYAAAIGDFLQTLPGEYDVFGYHTGALIAAELAATRPERVRKVVLVAVPLFSDERRAAYEASPEPPNPDGSHLVAMWNSTMRVRPEGQSIERAAEIVAEKQRAGSRAWWAGPAIFAYDTRAALAKIGQPVLVLRPQDGLFENTAKAAELLRDVRLIDYDEFGYGFFDSHPERVAIDVDRFLTE